ncbi:MAG: glycosyltransferase [Cyanobacteriota bacterium]|nr:glycosyltransferase [Cyanobacteriota bacterium]
MKLVIPIEFYRTGGVERVIVSLIRELSQKIEKIVLILPPKDFNAFQQRLPPSDRLIYESFVWQPNSSGYRNLILLYKLSSALQKLKLKASSRKLDIFIKRFRVQSRVNYIIDQHQATHCLYVLSNRLPTRDIKTPLATIAYDLFWQFSPMTYPKAYVRKYNERLLEWLQKTDVVFSISEKTRSDILKLFPGYEEKIKTVPLAGFLNAQAVGEAEDFEEEVPIFYFPSSFGIYKDQLGLLKASVKLAQKGLKFKVFLTGRETDNLVDGNLSLSQQSQTQEYIEYFNECKRLYKENTEIFKEYFKGFGYCAETVVESCYKSCACVVMPSRYEGFGLALSEAIVRGLPVISSDLDVLYEQVELYECGDRVEFFPQGDVEALANRMEQFLLNPKPKLSPAEIQQRFSRWTWEDVAKRYIELLESVS